MVRWQLQPLQPRQKTLQPPFGPSVDSLCHPWLTTTNLSPIGFLFLKLPPPPCAVLLADFIWFICESCMMWHGVHRARTYADIHTGHPLYLHGVAQTGDLIGRLLGHGRPMLTRLPSSLSGFGYPRAKARSLVSDVRTMSGGCTGKIWKNHVKRHGPILLCTTQNKRYAMYIIICIYWVMCLYALDVLLILYMCPSDHACRQPELQTASPSETSDTVKRTSGKYWKLLSRARH